MTIILPKQTQFKIYLFKNLIFALLLIILIFAISISFMSLDYLENNLAGFFVFFLFCMIKSIT